MVIILPCAGGCAANFNKYISNKKISAYEYAGHWTRYEEPLFEYAEDIIDPLYRDIIEGMYGNDIDLFGHSMGGLLAWILAEKLIKSGFHVKHLYIAACCEPKINPTFVKQIKNDTDIKNTLKMLRQVPDRVLNSEFFNDNLLPPIRSDFSIVKGIIENAQDKEIESLPIGITCLYGVDDPVVRKEDMVGWKRYTSGKFRCIGYKGDHFFLYEKNNISKIVSLIKHAKCF